MNLSERLAAAAQARAARATPPRETAGAASPSEPGVADDADDAATPPVAVTVVLPPAPGVAVVTATPDPEADPTSVCPTCGRTGDIGIADLPGRTAHYHCGSCGTMWRTSLDIASPRDAGLPAH